MSRVAVSRSVLDWALDRSGMTLDLLEQKKSLSKVRQWATGERQPTLRQLEDLARKTHTPLGFFFLEEPPEERLPVPFFRTLGDEAPVGPSPELLDTVHAMQRRQAWMREFLIEQGQEALPFVRSVRPDEPPGAAGQAIRSALGLDAGWAAEQATWSDALRFLHETMEAKGILVIVNGVVGNNTHRKLDPEEFRGFVMVDDHAPLVFVNGADYRAPQMFTLAHELAHVFFGSSAAFDLREMLPADDPTEQACNKAAAEFLVPEQEMRQVWSSVRSDPGPFQSIARQFKVSALVGARRALDLGLIDRDEFGAFYRRYLNGERRRAASQPGGGDFYANQNLRVGRRFARTVIRAAREGKLLYSEAYRLTGLHGKSFADYAAALGT